MIKHGMSHKKEYNTWYAIKRRCYNKNNKAYPYYGGRGIEVCDRWLQSFDNFFLDMGFAPSNNHSIERINNDGNYEPINCMWATKKEQCNNRSNTIYVKHKGENRLLSEWAKLYSLSYKLVHKRYKSGWDLEDIFSISSKPISFEYNGQNKTLMEWSAISGIPYKTLRNRFNYGWSAKQILKDDRIIIDGIKMSIAKAEKVLKLPKSRLTLRLKRGYSLEEAIMIPPRSKSK